VEKEMTDRKKPIAGELWKEVQHDWLLFITHVSDTSPNDAKNIDPEYERWVHWDNLEKKMTGNASLNWFMRNCKKIS
jgi:hypothetical protein